MESVKLTFDRSTLYGVLQTISNFCDKLPPDKKYDIEIKEHRNRRSLDANAYCWVLCDKLAQHTRLPKTEIYRRAIKEIGGVSDTVCVKEVAADKLCKTWEANGIGWMTERAESKFRGCANITLYYGSSTYDTAQMSRLIDNIIQECKDAEIETMTPMELAQLMEAWDEKK